MTTQTPAERALDAVRLLHRPDVHRECGARTTATVEHSNGGASERRLLCTLPPEHDGQDHKDQVCCYRFHTFSDAYVEEYAPRNLTACYHDRQVWPCATVRAMRAAEEG